MSGPAYQLPDDIPPHAVARVDQQLARDSALLDAAISNYRSHTDTYHDGVPTTCAYAAVLMTHMSCPREDLLSIIAAAVARIAHSEREGAHR